MEVSLVKLACNFEVVVAVDRNLLGGAQRKRHPDRVGMGGLPPNLLGVNHSKYQPYIKKKVRFG